MNRLKRDILLILGILAAAGLLWLLPFFGKQSGPAVVRVLQEGTVTETYSLLENRTVYLSCGDEAYNLLLIHDGTASISDANCPDGLCVRAGSISRNGESIICLPHKLVIQIESKEESELDAVTY